MQTQPFGYVVGIETTRAQVPIFDTTQMGDFCQLWVLCIVFNSTWTLLPFPGSLLKNKRGIFGYGVYRILTFDNDYLLGNIHSYSIAAYVSMRTSEMCFLIRLVEY